MLEVVQIPRNQMSNEFLENLHLSVFKGHLPAEYFRFDGCMVTKNKEENLVSYALYREISSETVELAWGGTTDEKRGFASKTSLEMFTNECLKHYENVTYQTHNKNIPMLKLGLALDFIVVGCRVVANNELFLILNRKRG